MIGEAGLGPWSFVECSFCKTTRDPFAPCSRPREEHIEGIEIHSGPDSEGDYVYTRWWWRDDIKRQRAQVFRSSQHMDSDEWRAAWRVYCDGKPSWHI
jgi:hypothetical protein